MKQTRDSVWQRRGTSWIWDEDARNLICTASEVWSLRKLLRSVGHWPDELPSNSGTTVVVAGLDGALDLLRPQEAEVWLGELVKESILSFQAAYESQASLVFWLPSGRARISVHPANDSVEWQCAAPFGNLKIAFGRVLWGEANEYPQEIILEHSPKPAGLFHLRIT
jgi:hypothetical protein